MRDLTPFGPVLVLLCLPAVGGAQDYPNKAIRCWLSNASTACVERALDANGGSEQ